MKRFYKKAGVTAQDGGYAVVLDNRPVRTPARRPLVVPSAALAGALAQEWDEQGEEVDPRTMPLMRLVATALDRVAAERAGVEADLRAFGASDLLCYRAEAPAELVERQGRAWQPVVDWAALRLDAALVVTAGLVPVEQPAQALAALGRPLAELDDLDLVAVHAVAVATGSLLLALALHVGEIDARQAFEAGLLDELYGLEVWGEDPEARRRLEGLEAEIRAAERLLLLLRRG